MQQHFSVLLPLYHRPHWRAQPSVLDFASSCASMKSGSSVAKHSNKIWLQGSGSIYRGAVDSSPLSAILGSCQTCSSWLYAQLARGSVKTSTLCLVGHWATWNISEKWSGIWWRGTVDWKWCIWVYKWGWWVMSRGSRGKVSFHQNLSFSSQHSG